MIFPESVEDISLIADMYGMTEDDLETWMETLTSYIDVLTTSSSQFLSESADLDTHREEAQQYSMECSLLSQELASRVKYDETLAVAVENLAWECVLAAGLAEELEAQMEELNRLAEVLEAHCDVARAFRDLIHEYLFREADDDDDSSATPDVYSGYYTDDDYSGQATAYLRTNRADLNAGVNSDDCG